MGRAKSVGSGNLFTGNWPMGPADVPSKVLAFQAVVILANCPLGTMY